MNPEYAAGGMPSFAQGKQMQGKEMPSGGMEEQAAQGRTPGEEMRGRGMEGQGGQGRMPEEAMPGAGGAGGERQSVLVTLRVPEEKGAAAALQMAPELSTAGFQIDPAFQPIPVEPAPTEQQDLTTRHQQLVVVVGTIPEDSISRLRELPNVVRVDENRDVLMPFSTAARPASNMLLKDQGVLVGALTEEQHYSVELGEAFGACPIGSCDYQPTVAKGTIADVARSASIRSGELDMRARASSLAWLMGVSRPSVGRRNKVRQLGFRASLVAGLPTGVRPPRPGATTATCARRTS